MDALLTYPTSDEAPVIGTEELAASFRRRGLKTYAAGGPQMFLSGPRAEIETTVAALPVAVEVTLLHSSPRR